METEWDGYDFYAKIPFTVLRFEDLTKRIDLMEKKCEQTITTVGCFACKTKTPLTLKASIPFMGYTPGQNIRITIFIDNKCGFNISRTIICLKRKHIFSSVTPEKRTIFDTKTIAKAIYEGVKNKTSKKILASIAVPNLCLNSSLVSRICQLTYIIKVSVCVVGFIKKPHVEFPICIGNKPLNYNFKLNA